jgi:hypothetical protein
MVGPPSGTGRSNDEPGLTANVNRRSSMATAGHHKQTIGISPCYIGSQNPAVHYGGSIRGGKRTNLSLEYQTPPKGGRMRLCIEWGSVGHTCCHLIGPYSLHKFAEGYLQFQAVSALGNLLPIPGPNILLGARSRKL